MGFADFKSEEDSRKTIMRFFRGAHGTVLVMTWSDTYFNSLWVYLALLPSTSSPVAFSLWTLRVLVDIT